ncbi:MAG: thiosulfate sulfurtransferase GlpE [Pseudomonadales bacterium]|nr:thiosulfate sulfurtransferase GlpE [Pseudomonadales bacterium]
MAFTRIDVAKAQELIARNALVVDIRDAESYAQGSIPGAIHLPGDMVGEFLEEADCTRPLIVCCYHGHASQGAAAYFAHKGFEEIYSLDGGYEAWADSAGTS